MAPPHTLRSGEHGGTENGRVCSVILVTFCKRARVLSTVSLAKLDSSSIVRMRELEQSFCRGRREGGEGARNHLFCAWGRVSGETLILSQEEAQSIL